MGLKKWMTALSIASVLLAGAGWRTVYGLSDEEIYRRLRFNFIIPGGRSLALGGAFIAEGDDATAAASNPAALNYVSQQEFFLEYRSTSYDDEVFRAGATKDPRIVAQPRTYLRMQLVDNEEDTSNLGFISYVVPFTMGKRRARVAFSRQVLLDVETSLSKGNERTSADFINPSFPAVWIDPSTNPPRPSAYMAQVRSSGYLDAEIVQYNLAFSYAVGTDLSIGFTLSQANIDLRATVRNRFHDPKGILFPGNPRDWTSEGQAKDFGGTTFTDDTDSAFGYTIGIHWHPDSSFGGYSPWRFGMVYRRGARLEVDERVSFSSSLEPGAARTVRTVKNVLKIPDRFGVGVSYHGNRWVFTIDGERIQYSDLMEDFVPGLNGLTNPTMRATWGGKGRKVPTYTVDDANVIHAGIEYLSTTKRRWTHFFRVGYYNEPDSRIRMSSVPGSMDRDTYMEAFRGGEDEDHFTVGYALSSPRGFELHLAGDFGDTTTTLVVSTIYRFGRLR